MFRVVRMMILQQTLPSSSAAGAAVHHACQTSKVLKYNKRGDRLARKTPKHGHGGKPWGRHQTTSHDQHRRMLANQPRPGTANSEHRREGKKWDKNGKTQVG